MSQPNSVIQEYFHLTDEYKIKYGGRTVVLLMVGSFMEIYGKKNPSTGLITGSNIQDVCEICNLQIAEKKVCVGNFQIVMAGMRDYCCEKYVKILVENGYTVPVFIQKKTDDKITRVLQSVYSPGTFLSYDTDASPKRTNNIMCIWLEQTKSFLNKTQPIMVCGLSTMNIFTGETYMFEYETQLLINPTAFDELERCVSVCSPSEIIFVSSFDEKTNNTILQYSGIGATERIHWIRPDDPKRKNCENQTYIHHILSVFYGKDVYDTCHEFQTSLISTQSFCFLLDFIQEHNPNLVKQVAFPRFINNSDRLSLPNHTLQQLNIIGENQHGNLSSVSTFLNKCCTSMGKRLFSYQITNPTCNVKWLETEYKMTAFLLEKENVGLMEILREEFKKIKDIEKMNRQIMIRKVYPSSLYQLHCSLVVIQSIYQKILEYKDTLKSSSTDINPSVSHCIFSQYLNMEDRVLSQQIHQITNFLEENLQLEECKTTATITTFETNIIQKGVSPKLDELVTKQQNSISNFHFIRDYLNQLLRTSEKDTKNTEYVKIHETEKSGSSLQITKTRANIMKKIIQQELKKDAECRVRVGSDNEHECFLYFKDIAFVPAGGTVEEIQFPLLTTICRFMLHIEDKINKEIACAFEIILQKMEDQFCAIIENHSQYIAKLDVLQTKAHLARKYNYCRPFIEEDAEKSFVNIADLRHCLIEHINQSEIYVTNNIVLGCGDKDGILLYGTNAVGKTSLIRAVGISIIMAQSGIYVPATHFCFQPYRAIYSRILGNDNLFKGLSTFAVEMSELRVILKMADENSIVLGDEVCSGTETVSALSIFVTTLQHLYKLKSSYIFATHFHEITGYAEIREIVTLHMKHLSIEYDAEKDCLVYFRKLQDGAGSSNYGLIVAKSLHLPDDFMENAYAFRKKHFPTTAGELSNKPTIYNSKKIKSMCEICNVEIAEEIHHIQPQKDADEHGFIRTFHKNHPANLQGLCSKCHDVVHNNSGKIIKTINRKENKTN
jgi:DNA mismatch repair protein MutS